MSKSNQKIASIEQLSNNEGIISALAFDQRGALKRMMAKHQTEEPTVAQIEQLKVLVAEELTQYASSILLDPEYGLPASDARNKDCGLLLAYEKTGYDVNAKGRLPDCLVEWSAKRLKDQVQMLLNSYFTMMLMMLKKLTFKRKHTLKESVQNVLQKTFLSS